MWYGVPMAGKGIDNDQVSNCNQPRPKGLCSLFNLNQILTTRDISVHKSSINRGHVREETKKYMMKVIEIISRLSYVFHWHCFVGAELLILQFSNSGF